MLTHDIRDADEDWNPEEGGELKGKITDVGFDPDDIKALNVAPFGEQHIVRMPLVGKIGEAWHDSDAELGDEVKITRHEDIEPMRARPEEEAETNERYSFEVLD